MKHKVTIWSSSPAVIVFIIFIILKLTNTVDWDWIWIFAPLWAPFVVILGALVLIISIIIIFAIWVNIDERIYNKRLTK